MPHNRWWELLQLLSVDSLGKCSEERQVGAGGLGGPGVAAVG